MSVLDRTALERPAVNGAAPARLDITRAISHSRLLAARPAERRGVRLVTFAALALYGVLRWGTLMSSVPGWRLVGLALFALAIFGFGTRALRAPRALREWHATAAREQPAVRFLETGWRRAVLCAFAAIVTLAVVLALAGVTVSWLYRLRVAVIARGIGSGLTALPGTLVPYIGINPWVRLVIVVGAGLLLVGAALASALPSRLPAETRRATGALLLAALAVIPATIIHPELPYVQGLLLFILLAAFMWGERVVARRSSVAFGVIAATALFAAILAPALHERQPWLNYQKLASSLAPKNLERFDWSQRYGPYVWPRHNRDVLTIKAAHADYWKAQDLDVFNGFGWSQGTGPLGTAPPGPRRSAVKHWTQTLTVTVGAMKTTDVVAAGLAAPPEHAGTVNQGPSQGTWVASSPLHPGQTYTVKTYSPRPTAAELGAIPTSAYPDASLADYRVVGLPASALTNGYAPQVEFPIFHSDGPALSVTNPYGVNGIEFVEHSPYARAYRLARSLAAGSATPYAFVAAVEHYLSVQNGFRYDEHTPIARYPLLTFLFSTKHGYCQHFAGAMALLLRLGGMPARVVTGFTAGLLDSSTGTYIVSDRDAHAWVEVWFPHYGWVRFDPTPAAAPEFADSANAAITGAPSSKPGGLHGAPRVRDAGGQAGSQSVGQGGSSLGLTIGLPLALVLAALAVMLFWWRRSASSEQLTSELERALVRCGRATRGGLTLHALEYRFRESSAAVSYLRRLRLARYGRLSELPTTEQRRALRSQLAAGLGIRGWIRSWWALPPRRLRVKDS